MSLLIELVLAFFIIRFIFRFIRKHWKPFWTQFIPKFFKITMWTTLVLSVLFVGFVTVDFTYHYTKDYVCDKEFLVTEHMLPSDLMPQIREYGVRKTWRRWYDDRSMPYEEFVAQIKEQEAIAKEEQEALAMKKSLRDHDLFPFWYPVANYLYMKYGLFK